VCITIGGFSPGAPATTIAIPENASDSNSAIPSLTLGFDVSSPRPLTKRKERPDSS
jgi:hypothetical protein